jgi:hypothetical protein
MIKTVQKPPIGDILSEIINDYGLLTVIGALLRRILKKNVVILPTSQLSDHLRRDIGLGPVQQNKTFKTQIPPRIF